MGGSLTPTMDTRPNTSIALLLLVITFVIALVNAGTPEKGQPSDVFNLLGRHHTQRAKRFPVGLYYSLMGEDLTNPQKRPDYDVYDMQAY
ncbi:hypothetical protein Q1695_012181 [Nippostrongylus brasiliensis]|nr:hypothetical protein Q1695_012181 [Nippostrongylus brasiliensis]